MMYMVKCMTLVGAVWGATMVEERTRVEVPPPPAKEECVEKQVLRAVDAICLRTGGFANGESYYTCIDKKGEQFIVTRTLGTHS